MLPAAALDPIPALLPAAARDPIQVLLLLSRREIVYSIFVNGRKKDLRTPKTKKKRLSVWTHDFVCLASTAATKPPTSLEAGQLIRADLGKKQLSMMEDGDSTELHSELIDAFPKLQEGGGYDLLRVGDTGGQRRELCLIPPPSEGYTVSYLKEVLRQAKCFVRPMQQNLSLDAVACEAVVSATNDDVGGEGCCHCCYQVRVLPLNIL